MFDIPLPIYFFIKEHPLKTSNKRTYIPLLINPFASSTELEHSHPLKISIKRDVCKFKIGKTTYSKS